MADPNTIAGAIEGLKNNQYGFIQTKTVTYTAAQLQACFTTPIQILPPPGAGLVYCILAVMSQYTFDTESYSTPMVLNYGTAFGGVVICVLDVYGHDASAVFMNAISGSIGNDNAELIGQPIIITGEEDSIDGDGSGRITVMYTTLATA